MSNGATPWSVKGIDPRAREAAREAARARGLTIGEWLNQAILANEAALAAARQSQPPSAAPAGFNDDALQQLSDRVDANDRRAALAIGNMDRSLTAIGARLEAASRAVQTAEASGGPDNTQVDGLLAELREAQSALLLRMRKIEEEEIVALKGERRHGAERLTAIEDNVSQLAARVSGAEAGAGETFKALETSIAALDEKVARAAGQADASQLEARFAAIADGLTARVEETRAEFAGQLAAAMGDLKPEDMRDALGDLSKRIAATERRHAQTIEAVSIEIKRLNESMERRLRAIEARNDDGFAATEQVREQVREIAEKVDQRFIQFEQREQATFTHIAQEIAHIADRLEHRVGVSEANSAQAIAQVGEQVAIMAERLNDRQDRLVSELASRLTDSEDRQAAHLNDAMGQLSAYLDHIEGRVASGADPLHDAMEGFAERLEAIEARIGAPSPPPFPPEADEEPDPAPAPAETASLLRPDLNEDDFAEPEIAAAPAPDVEPLVEDRLRTALDDETLASHHAALREMVTHLHQRATQMQEDVAPETIFVEDIEQRFRARDSQDFEPLEPEAAGGDPFADLAPPAEDDDDIWATGRAEDARAPDYAAEPFAADLHDTPLGDTPEEGFDDADDLYSSEVDKIMFDSALDKDPLTTSRDDYISSARKAALAGGITTPASAAKAEKPRGGLRGAARVMLWTAATAAAAAAASGAYYYTQIMSSAEETGARPEPSLPRAAAPAPALAAAPSGSIAEAMMEDSATSEAAAPEAATPLEDHAAPTGGGAPEEKPVRAGPVTPFASLDGAALQDAAAKGDAVAQFELAMTRLETGDAPGAAGLLKRAAGKGLAMAQYRLAKLYEHGQGVAADGAAARRLTEQAARAGNAGAMHDYGVYLANGEGAALDEAGAFAWFKEAADRGVVDSQYNVGLLFAQGRGVAPDAASAYFWFTVAAANGDKDAAARAAMLERDFSRADLAALRQNAKAFQARAGDAMANGDFGARAWAPTLQAAVSTPPQS